MQRPVLFSGVTGVGKSVITVAALEGLRERKGVVPYTINFSAQTQVRLICIHMFISTLPHTSPHCLTHPHISRISPHLVGVTAMLIATVPRL